MEQADCARFDFFPHLRGGCGVPVPRSPAVPGMPGGNWRRVPGKELGTGASGAVPGRRFSVHLLSALWSRDTGPSVPPSRGGSERPRRPVSVLLAGSRAHPVSPSREGTEGLVESGSLLLVSCRGSSGLLGSCPGSSPSTGDSRGENCGRWGRCESCACKLCRGAGQERSGGSLSAVCPFCRSSTPSISSGGATRATSTSPASCRAVTS